MILNKKSGVRSVIEIVFFLLVFICHCLHLYTDHLWDSGGMASGSFSTMLYNKGHVITKEKEASGIWIFAYNI